jgi:hypothetical protein
MFCNSLTQFTYFRADGKEISSSTIDHSPSASFVSTDRRPAILLLTASN